MVNRDSVNIGAIMKPASSRHISLSPHLKPPAPNAVVIASHNQPWVTPAWQGAFWKILSCACFAGINGIVRYLTGGSPIPLDDPLPVGVITFFQNVFGTLCMLPWLLRYGLGSLYTKHPGLHIIRISSAVLGVLLWYWALAHMPIAQAVGLMFTGPVFSAIAARIFLKETVDKRRGIAMLLSFVGAFIILRPDRPLLNMNGDFEFWVALLPLSAAIAIAITKINTRQLGKLGESAHMMTIYLLLFMAPISLIPALMNWKTPSLNHWPWLLLMGLLAAGAHFSTSIAYVKGEVTFLTPFGFSKLIFSSAIGYLAFAEFPGSWNVWIGALVIFSSVILLSNFRAARSRKSYVSNDL